MPVNPDDFETHANRVNNDYNDEIARRNVISRKYYYAFHYVRENGRNHQKSNFNNGSGDHGHAKDFLRKIGHPKLAQELKSLHQARKKADYELQKTTSQQDVRKVDRRLRSFINKVRYII